MGERGKGEMEGMIALEDKGGVGGRGSQTETDACQDISLYPSPNEAYPRLARGELAHLCPEYFPLSTLRLSVPGGASLTNSCRAPKHANPWRRARGGHVSH